MDGSHAKRRKIDPEVTEEGVMVLTIKYNRYIVWGLVVLLLLFCCYCPVVVVICRKEYNSTSPKSILNEYSKYVCVCGIEQDVCGGELSRTCVGGD